MIIYEAGSTRPMGRERNIASNVADFNEISIGAKAINHHPHIETLLRTCTYTLFLSEAGTSVLVSVVQFTKYTGSPLKAYLSVLDAVVKAV